VTLELLYFHQQAWPFRSFVLHLADSRVLRVENPEFVSISADSRSIEIFSPGTADAPIHEIEYIDATLIVSIRLSTDG
jgi:hypothetical protein